MTRAADASRVAVLISGRGSNLASLLADQDGYRIVAVISNRTDAAGLERARAAGIPTAVIDHRGFASRDEFETVLRDQIETFAPDLVVLAGFMRVLGRSFVDSFATRMINIHPSLLPAYRGLHTHRRVIAAGDRRHGASVHYVTAELDGGPLVAQASLAVDPRDNEEQLAARVLDLEHVLLPWCVRAIAAGDVRLGEEGRVHYCGQPLAEPVEPLS